MGKEKLTRRTLIGSAALAGLSGCGEPEPTRAQTDGVRLNIIFHGVMVYWVGDTASDGVVVYLPKSDQHGASVHQYRIAWAAHPLGQNPRPGERIKWRGLPEGNKPKPSGLHNLVLKGRKDYEPTNIHIALELPYPDTVEEFRYSVARDFAFDRDSLPDQVANPAMLAFPVVFSYKNPSPGLKLRFEGESHGPFEIAAYDRGNPVNIHIHADPTDCLCSGHEDHIFVNNAALKYKGTPLKLKYADLSSMRGTSVHPNHPELQRLGLSPNDLRERCEGVKCITPKGKESAPHIMTLPPDSCFGMWVID